MLRLIAGKLWELHKRQGLVTHVSDVFDLLYEDEWFDSDWAIDLVQDVDHITVPAGKSVFEALSAVGLKPENLCGGTKAVMVVAHTDYLVSMLMMGENCYKYLFRAIKGKDKRMGLTSYCCVQDSDFCGETILLENTGDLARNSEEFEMFFTRLGGMFG